MFKKIIKKKKLIIIFTNNFLNLLITFNYFNICISTFAQLQKKKGK